MIIPLKRQFPHNISGYIFLAAIWLFSGFVLGTLVLLFPLRMWVNFVRNNNLSATTENIVVILMIALLVVSSFKCSFKLFRWQYLKKNWVAKIIALVIPALAAMAALWLFMHPGIINNDEVNTVVSPKFTIGPYPTEEKMRKLKNEGYTAIVSLLHPAVVPFEPSLIKDEEATAKKLRLELIKAPMLPWVGDNERVLDSIKNIILKGKGKYYFHCYLGKDRVNVVKNLILELRGRVDNENPNNQRTFEAQGVFERGDIYKIDSAVYMTAFPTDEEILAFFLAGNVKSVINLMDSTDKEATMRIEKERTALKKMNIHYRVITVNENANDETLIRLFESLDSLPKPLVVHHWNTTCPQSILVRKKYFDKTKYVQVNLAKKNEAIN